MESRLSLTREVTGQVEVFFIIIMLTASTCKYKLTDFLRMTKFL